MYGIMNIKFKRTVCLRGYEMFSLVLRGYKMIDFRVHLKTGHRMRVSENGVLRIFNGKSRESQKAVSDCIMRKFVKIYCQADPSGRAV
jgi:hypothetical protein